MSVVEKSTNIPMRSIGYEFNKQVSSSDLNEMQSIALNNVIGYIDGQIAANTFKLSIESNTDQEPGITITGFKYLLADTNGVKYFGSIAPTSVALTYPGTPAVDSEYDIYAYFRVIEADSTTVLYQNGIRSNVSQSSIVEATITNNIADPTLGEISNRKSVEFTFVVLAKDATPVELTGWSAPTKIATSKLDTDLASTITPIFSLGGNVAVDGETIIKNSAGELAVNEFTGTKQEALAAFDSMPEGGTIYTTDEEGGGGSNLGFSIINGVLCVTYDDGN